MIRESYTLSTNALTQLRQVLDNLTDQDIITDPVAAYALDQTKESVESSLEAFDRQKTNNQRQAQRKSDGHPLFWIRRQVRSGPQRIYLRQKQNGFEVYVDEDETDPFANGKVPAWADLEDDGRWVPAPRHMIQGDLKIVFEDEDAKKELNETLEDLASIQETVTFTMISESEFVERDPLDLDGSDMDLIRPIRRLLVAGNQEAITTDENDEREE